MSWDSYIHEGDRRRQRRRPRGFWHSIQTLPKHVWIVLAVAGWASFVAMVMAGA